MLFFRSILRTSVIKKKISLSQNVKFSVSSILESINSKENINIGTIGNFLLQNSNIANQQIILNANLKGHIDHGKTTLTSAITKVLAEKNLAKFVSYDRIDSAPEEKRRGITINLMHVGYSTGKRNYAHVDCPGHADFVKNMITGTSQMDAAILVIAASEGVMPQTKEHLALAKAIGVKNIVVYLNKADIADKEMIELVELEVRELLTLFGYNGDKIPIVCGSALHALNGTNDEMGKNSIFKLMNIIDSQVPTPERDTSSAFQLPIEKSVSVPGRGQVLVGTVSRGTLKKGDPIDLVGYGEVFKTAASEIHIFKNPVSQCAAGDHVGILARGIKPNAVKRGMVAAVPNSVQQTNNIEASIYVLRKDEGGRKNPITAGYIQPMFVNIATIDCLLNLPSDKNLLMGGDNLNLNVILKSPLVVKVGDKFTIRESLSLTSITGVITKLLPKTDKEIHPTIVKKTPSQSSAIKNSKVKK